MTNLLYIVKILVFFEGNIIMVAGLFSNNWSMATFGLILAMAIVFNLEILEK